MLRLRFWHRKSDKIKAIKSAIKNGTYDLDKAVEDSADRIANYPQALLWK